MHNEFNSPSDMLITELVANRTSQFHAKRRVKVSRMNAKTKSLTAKIFLKLMADNLIESRSLAITNNVYIKIITVEIEEEEED